MQLCLRHALSCIELAFRHATETHLEFEAANKDEEKKAGDLQSVALDFKLLEVGPNSGLLVLESSAHDEPQAPVSCPSGVPRIRCALLGWAYAALITLTRLASGYKYLLFDCPKSRWHFDRFEACFYCQNTRRVARTVHEHSCTCHSHLTRLDRQWKRLERVFTLRISGAPPESSFPLKARRPNSGWTLLYAFYAWNLSDGSIGNEKGYSVFLPSEYQARRPKVPFRSRRVARTVGEHFCTFYTWNLSDGSIGNEKGYSVFLPALRISGAPPESSFPLKARRPNSGWTLLYVVYLKSIWRFDRQWERLQRVFTLRTSGAPPESSFPLKARRPNSGWTLLYVLYLKSIWRFDRQWERLQRVFTLRISGAPPESSFPLKAHRPNSGWTLLYVLYLKSIWRFDRQ